MPPKTRTLKAKVTAKMKRALEQVARKRGESEASVVREAMAREIQRAKRSGLL